MDPSLEYACKRVQELESLLLVEQYSLPKSVWFSQNTKMPGNSRHSSS